MDYILHAATRDGIARYSAESKAYNIRIENSLKDDIVKLESRFDSTISEFKRSNEAIEARIDKQFQKIDHRFNWMIGTMFAIGVGLTGLIIKMH